MSPARPVARKRSRAAALQVLYAIDVTLARSGGHRDEVAREALARAIDHIEIPPGAREFAEALVLGVCEHIEQLDALIAAHASHWRVERMATVDRNALRIGAYEIVCRDVPAAVAIDEAVELARRFGGEHSPAFVNGVLDAIAKECQPPRAEFQP